MSIFKQVESLTPEEILELVDFLSNATEKLDKRRKAEKQNSTLNKNLNAAFSDKSETLAVPTAKNSKLDEYERQYSLLVSAKNKLKIISEVIKGEES